MWLSIVSSDKASELKCAIAAGLSVSGLHCLLLAVDSEPFELLRCVKSVIISVASYSGIALLLLCCWKGGVRRVIPVWLPIAILGTAVLASTVGISVGIDRWHSPQRMERTLAEFIAVQLNDLQSLFIVLCIITLPVTAIVYYAKVIAKVFLNQGPEQLPSILGNPTEVKR